MGKVKQIENKNRTYYFTRTWSISNFESNWLNGIESKIQAINSGKENDYGKEYIKIKFNSDNDLSLNKSLKFHAMAIIIRSVFEEDSKLYPQVFLDDAFYEL